MEKIYNPQQVELQAQTYWQHNQSFVINEQSDKEKFYCLSMFPYPSGNLHMGHVRNYTLGDVISRYQRMCGKNVLQPIGWDAFGLPAENAAIKHKVAPAKWTYENIDHMRGQFKRLGNAYDWSKEFATCDPKYYRWEQWLFIKLYEKGLVYKKNAVVNWDPVDETVLANEQVVDGRGWRSGALVERREIPQWFIKITAYADELIDSLDKLTGWPEQVRTMQRNWIGRSEGVEIQFEVLNYDEPLAIYTTRIDTLFGATYVAVATDHPLAQLAAKNNVDIAHFNESCRHLKVSEAELATTEKQGIDSGFKAVNPVNGETIPVWIGNYVLMEYGSGAVMAVPAHDQRDWEFAKKYQLTMRQVLKPVDEHDIDLSHAPFTDEGITINSEPFNDLDFSHAVEQMSDVLISQGKAKRKTHYRLRDWGVSRQRYWGTPIPMIICDDCGTVPVPEQSLPVILPENIELTGKGGSPLAQHEAFIHTQCPTCGKDALRETDTFDTFVESSWYYARYACVDQHQMMLDQRADYWTPVDQYIGGIEHAVMHLLYARLFHKLMRDQGLVSSDEPFTELLTQGMVLKDGYKMSKSKGNTIDPGTLIDQYGADTVRLFTIFASPPEQSLEWSDSGVEGTYRFLKRLWQLCVDSKAIAKLNPIKPSFDSLNLSDAEKAIRHEIHTLLQQALYDFERKQFNTVVSAVMKMLNRLIQYAAIDSSTHKALILNESISILLRILSPITPHICHHLWQALAFGEAIIDATWPKVDSSALRLETLEFVVQVNGKLRGKVMINACADDETIIQTAIQDEKIHRFLQAKTIRKTIVIAKRQLINLVVSD